MIPAISLREALGDPALLGSALAGASWATWRALLLATMGEPLEPEELEIFRQVTQRTDPPSQRVEEALYLVGRRGGKDRAASVLASYLAALVDWSPVLAAGERGLVLCIGPDQRQAKITRDYIEGVFDSSEILAQLIANRTQDGLDLANGISIEVRAASFRRLRGLTCVAAIATEAAFWYDSENGGANVDAAILDAVRPSLATTRGPLLLITTPYARRGEVYKLHRNHFGPEGDPLILVAQGTSRDFNPTLPQKVVDRALARDHAAATSEYLAEFRSDIASLLSEEAITNITPLDVRELPPDFARRARGHFDAATGAGKDSAALAIAFEGSPVELAAVRRWKPPFSPSSVVREAAELLKSYGVRIVGTDRFAPNLIAELFREHGITCKVAKQDTSKSFVELLALINSQRVRLLDDPILLGELRRLERRPGSGQREIVGHPPGAHDDVAAAAAGALVSAAKPAPKPLKRRLVWGSARSSNEKWIEIET